MVVAVVVARVVAGTVAAANLVVARVVAGAAPLSISTGGAAVIIGFVFSPSACQPNSLRYHAPGRLITGQSFFSQPTSPFLMSSSQIGRRGVGSGTVESRINVSGAFALLRK